MLGSGDATTMDQCSTALVRETERLSMRIERLLDWGRMEAGRRLYELHPESVATLFDDAVKAFEPIRHRHPEVSFDVEVDADLPMLDVDRSAVLDALINLFSNAVKYGGEPPVVTLRARAAPGGVAIEVSDNGHGDPADGAPEDLREVLPRRRPALSRARGQRARAGDREARGPRAQRARSARQH